MQLLIGISVFIFIMKTSDSFSRSFVTNDYRFPKRYYRTECIQRLSNNQLKSSHIPIEFQLKFSSLRQKLLLDFKNTRSIFHHFLKVFDGRVAHFINLTSTTKECSAKSKTIGITTAAAMVGMLTVSPGERC